MEGHGLPDVRDKLEAMVRLELIDVVDGLVFHYPQVRGLTDPVAQCYEVGSNDPLQIQADLHSAGQAQDLAGQPIPPSDEVLPHVARLDECPEKAGNRRLVEADHFGDRRGPKPQVVGNGERLKNVQAADERASGQFLTPSRELHCSHTEREPMICETLRRRAGRRALCSRPASVGSWVAEPEVRLSRISSGR